MPLYPADELEPWADRGRELARKAKDTYVMSNNHNLGKAAVNALQLTSILNGHPVVGPATLIEHYPQRERIKRKKQRWVNRLQTMPTLERRALLAAIGEAWQLAPSKMAMEDPACSIAGNGDTSFRPLSPELTMQESSIAGQKGIEKHEPQTSKRTHSRHRPRALGNKSLELDTRRRPGEHRSLRS